MPKRRFLRSPISASWATYSKSFRSWNRRCTDSSAIYWETVGFLAARQPLWREVRNLSGDSNLLAKTMMNISGGAEPTLLKRSPLDSKRFGLEIYRGHIRPADVAILWEDIAQSGLDIGIFRLPAHAISAMKAYTGPRSQLIHADTLVYYEARLDKPQAPVFRNTPSMYREANRADQPELINLVFCAFANYENHYHANPAFSHLDILAGYGEWAVSHLNDVKQYRTWVVTGPDGFIGFMCCSFNTEKGDAEIVLNGVSPEHARKGIYSDLLKLAKQHFAGMGLERIRVSTQIGNYAVQRAWANEGFRLVEAFDTWHVNAFLSHRAVAKK